MSGWRFEGVEMQMIRKAAVLAACALTFAACGSGSDETTRDENGNVVEGGEIGVFSLNVGDCFSDLPVGEVSSVSGVPCAEDHTYEIYHLFDVDLPDFDSAAIQTATADGCLEAFESYMGVPFATSYYTYDGLQPSAGSWEQGDREVVCLATPTGGGVTAGTARGAGLLAESALADTTTTAPPTTEAPAEETATTEAPLVEETTTTAGSSGGSQSVFELNVGECYVDLFGSQVQTVEPVSCNDPHGIEVIALFDVELAEYESEALKAEAEAGCLAAFEPYMGATYAESWYGLDFLQPSSGSWTAGDREVICVVFPFEEDITQSVGSAQGEGRLLGS